MDASLPALIAALTITGAIGYVSWARATYKERMLRAYYQYKRYLDADFNPCIIVGLFGPRVVKFCPKSMQAFLDILQDEYGEWHEYRWTTQRAYYKAIKTIY